MNTPTLIEQIYFRYDETKNSSSAESREALNKCRKEFTNQNPNLTKETRNSADDVVIAYGEINHREGFIDGFRYAVKLMCEVYTVMENNEKLEHLLAAEYGNDETKPSGEHSTSAEVLAQ